MFPTLFLPLGIQEDDSQPPVQIGWEPYDRILGNAMCMKVTAFKNLTFYLSLFFQSNVEGHRF